MDLHILLKKINDLKKITDQVFIYGFGSYGRNLYKILKKNNILVDGFVISGEPDSNCKHEIPIYCVSDLLAKKIGYILALNERNCLEVSCILKKNLVDSKYIINAGKYIEQFGIKRGTRTGSIEITTIIGCRVNCKYCPQDLLINNYFKEDKFKKRIMDFDTFKKSLDFFPQDYDISFGGMSEPFLNQYFIEMLKYACEKKRNISVYTTLVGAKRKDIEDMIKMPLQFVVLHVADKYEYAHIPLTEDYYLNIEQLIDAKKSDGRPFINMCNAQTEPDEKVQRICEGKYEILTEMTDRAGNLDDKTLIRNKIHGGRVRCGNSGMDLNSNILLPDGSVILCCMDYGLKHILGNIHKNTFEEIMNGEEMKNIKRGMEGDESIDILCRSCSYARKI